MNLTLSWIITAETPITAEVWQTLMEQLNDVNQDNKLLKEAYKKKAQENQYWLLKPPNKTRHQQLNPSLNKRGRYKTN